MTKTDNLVSRAMRRLDKSLSAIYEEHFPSREFRETGLAMEFWTENRKIDESLTKRLAVRPITSVEIDAGAKNATDQFRALCVKEKNRNGQKPTRAFAPKGRERTR